MPPMRGAAPKIDKPFKVLGRIFKTIFKVHPVALFIVFALIITYTIANTIAISNVNVVVDSLYNYIKENGTYVGYDLNTIVKPAIIMGCLYVYVALASYGSSRIMIDVSQDTLKYISFRFPLEFYSYSEHQNLIKMSVIEAPGLSLAW